MAALLLKSEPGTYKYHGPEWYGMHATVIAAALEQEIRKILPGVWVRYDPTKAAIAPGTQTRARNYHVILLGRDPAPVDPVVTDHAALVACAALYESPDRRFEMNFQVCPLATAQQFAECRLESRYMAAEQNARQTVATFDRAVAQAAYRLVSRIDNPALKGYLCKLPSHSSWDAMQIATLCQLAGISYWNLLESVARKMNNG